MGNVGGGSGLRERMKDGRTREGEIEGQRDKQEKESGNKNCLLQRRREKVRETHNVV